MTHTQGPWHVGMKPGPFVYGPKGEQVADMQHDLVGKDEHVANFRLIAAAPDLLAACKAALDVMEVQDVGHGGTQSYVRAAIAKAEGR